MLRPGEAVEQLVRLAVEMGSVAEVYAKVAKPGRAGQAIDEVLFSSSTVKIEGDPRIRERTLGDW